jgi:hypothetical protein
MDGGQVRPSGDGLGFDSTVYARPKPTGKGILGPNSRGPVVDPSSPWIFGPLFPSATRTTLPVTSEAKSTPSPTPTPSQSVKPSPSPPPKTTEAPPTSEPPQTTKEPDPEQSPTEKTSIESSSKESSSLQSSTIIILSTSSPSSTPSTLETVTSSSESTLSELQPSVSSLSTLEPFAPVETSTSRSSSSSYLPVPPPASHTGDASSQPNTEGAEKGGKTSGGTIGGIVGGVSAAILIGLLMFFCWKWRTRGRHRFNKRSSFDPYGNGIDANRGGLLVSSVACKPGDQLSGKETLCKSTVALKGIHANGKPDSDDHSPTRYQHQEREKNMEPTIPILKEPKPRTYSNSPPANRPPREQMREPFPPFTPEQSMNGAVQQPMRTHQPRPYPLLYERRRPPVPPSMRRNRSPTERTYGDYPPRHNPALSEPIPGIYAVEKSGLGFAGPYPQNSNIIRSNSSGGQRPSRTHPDMARMDRNRHVRRSASMNSLNHRGFAPQHMHSTIPEGPYPTMARPSGRHHKSSSAPQPNGTTYNYYDQPQNHHQPRRNLTVRNPTPVYSGAEKQTSRKPLTDMVRRATSKNKDDDEQPRQKPKHAAKNF